MRMLRLDLMRVTSSKFHFDVSSEFYFNASSKDDEARAGLGASFDFAKSFEFHFDEFRVQL